MNWQPISKWKRGTGKKFIFYHPAEVARRHRAIALDEYYLVDTCPLAYRRVTHFSEITPPGGEA